MDPSLYYSLLGILLGFVPLVFALFKSNSKIKEAQKKILDLEQDKFQMQKQNVDLRAQNLEMAKKLSTLGILEYMKNEAAKTKHDIRPASASSEPGPDDYHAKRKSII